MIDRSPPAPRRANPVRLAGGLLAALVLGATLGASLGATLGSGTARAQESPFDDPRPRRVRPHREARPLAVPSRPGPPVVTGYLPRNNNVPMYNQPPGMRSGAGW